jgi:hypothetical protein
MACQRALLQHAYHAQMNRAAKFAGNSARDLLRRLDITNMKWEEIAELIDKHKSALAELSSQQRAEIESSC